MDTNWLASATTLNVPAVVGVPSMFVSPSMRISAEPVASVIVTLAVAPPAGNEPLVIVTSSTRISRPSTASPAPPSASCDRVITCGAGGVAEPVGVTLVTCNSVRPLNCVTDPTASTVVPMPNDPKIVALAKMSMPPVASWM